MLLEKLLSKLRYHLWTLFLFSKADIKTAVIPITSFAAASAPLASLDRLPHVVFWTWFHILQFNVSNQTLKPEEDEHNNKDRPLPAKRITLQNALILRWVLVPSCFLLSACYSIETVYASIALCIVTFVYDEMGLAGAHWSTRNIMNALLFLTTEVGACLVAGRNRHELDRIGLLSVICSAGIFATTIQAQDFKDTVGDRLIGRKTLPIIAPNVARPTLMIALLTWTSALSVIWRLAAIHALAFYCLAIFVGGRFIMLNDIKADRRSFYSYSIWLSVAHALPAYFRFISSNATQ